MSARDAHGRSQQATSLVTLTMLLIVFHRGRLCCQGLVVADHAEATLDDLLGITTGAASILVDGVGEQAHGDLVSTGAGIRIATMRSFCLRVHDRGA